MSSLIQVQEAVYLLMLEILRQLSKTAMICTMTSGLVASYNKNRVLMKKALRDANTVRWL